MPIYIDNKKIKSIYVDNIKIGKIYVDNTLVYQSTSTPVVKTKLSKPSNLDYRWDGSGMWSGYAYLFISDYSNTNVSGLYYEVEATTIRSGITSTYREDSTGLGKNTFSPGTKIKVRATSSDLTRYEPSDWVYITIPGVVYTIPAGTTFTFENYLDYDPELFGDFIYTHEYEQVKLEFEFSSGGFKFDTFLINTGIPFQIWYIGIFLGTSMEATDGAVYEEDEGGWKQDRWRTITLTSDFKTYSKKLYEWFFRNSDLYADYIIPSGTQITFNDEIYSKDRNDTYAMIDIEFNFASNGFWTSSSWITYDTGKDKDEMRYLTNYDPIVVYEGKWLNDSYRTITTAKSYNDEELFFWLKSNSNLSINPSFRSG